ncbi:MAG: hypothetical protein HOZ81_24680 [Streptomyces sp.]|nr:hypothetical protein [Streptomyces sp.]
MNTRRVNTAADVILAALTQNRTAAGIAMALESAQLLMSPETAAELMDCDATPRYRAAWRGHSGAWTADYTAAWNEAAAAHERGERDAEVVHYGITSREWVAAAPQYRADAPTVAVSETESGTKIEITPGGGAS